MTERHLIAYLLIVLMLAVPAYGLLRWRRAQARRQHRRVGGH